MAITAPVEPKKRAMDSIRKLTAIATLPEITVKIIATVEDPNSTAAQLHKLITHDPALVTRILKLVNSSFYGLPGQISSIERAVVLVGLTAIKNIAVAASIGQMFRGARLCEQFSAKDLWTHCIAVAVGSRELARHLRMPIGDEAFLGGMIHDIGLLVSLQLWPEKVRQVCEAASVDGANFMEIERQVLGVDHAELGAALAEQWKFPKSCQQIAAYHHDPLSRMGEGRQLVAIVHVADALACQANLGFNLTAREQSLDPAHLVDLGISQQAVAIVKAGLPQLTDSARSVLG